MTGTEIPAPASTLLFTDLLVEEHQYEGMKVLSLSYQKFTLITVFFNRLLRTIKISAEPRWSLESKD